MMGGKSARPNDGCSETVWNGSALIHALAEVIDCLPRSCHPQEELLPAGTLQPLVVQEGWVVLWDDESTPRPVGWATRGDLLGYDTVAGRLVPSRFRLVAASRTKILIIGRRGDTEEGCRALQRSISRQRLVENAAWFAAMAQGVDGELGRCWVEPVKRARALGAARARVLGSMTHVDPMSREEFATAIHVSLSTASHYAPVRREDWLRLVGGGGEHLRQPTAREPAMDDCRLWTVAAAGNLATPVRLRRPIDSRPSSDRPTRPSA
jgi:hypothetical protein